MKVYSVGCNSCCGDYTETTEEYDPDVLASSLMIRVKPAYDYKLDGLRCPFCSGALTIKGKFNRLQFLREEVKAVPVTSSPVPEEENPEPDGEEPEPNYSIPAAVFASDNRAQCPYCDDRPNRQWWSRHMRDNHMEEISE